MRRKDPLKDFRGKLDTIMFLARFAAPIKRDYKNAGAPFGKTRHAAALWHQFDVKTTAN